MREKLVVTNQRCRMCRSFHVFKVTRPVYVPNNELFTRRVTCPETGNSFDILVPPPPVS